MNSSPENRMKSMRPPTWLQRPSAYAMPTTSQSAIGRGRAVSAPVEPPFPGEIAGQEGQHEETQIAGVEAGVLVQVDPEERRHLDGERRHHRKTEGDDGICSSPRSWLPGIRRDNDELLPEAVRVLAPDTPWDGVQGAHALPRPQESFRGG